MEKIMHNFLTEENRLKVALAPLDEYEEYRFRTYNSGNNFFFFSIKVSILYFDLTIKGVNFLQEAVIPEADLEQWINDPKKLIHTLKYCRKL